MAHAYKTHISRAGTKHAVPIPWVLWHGSYRIHRSSGYGYDSLTEIPELLGTGVKVLQNFQNSRVLWHGRTELPEVPGRYKHDVPVPRVFAAPRAERPEIPDTVMSVLQKLQKFFVDLCPGYGLCVLYEHNENRKVGYGYECREELTDVPGTGWVVENSQKSRTRVMP